MTVILIQEFGGMFEGSTFEVEKETKLRYKGTWCSMYGTYKVSVPKKVCRELKIIEQKCTCKCHSGELKHVVSCICDNGLLKYDTWYDANNTLQERLRF